MYCDVAILWGLTGPVFAFQKLYTEAWDEDKTMFYPYSDSPELRRVAKAQEVLSDVSRPLIFAYAMQYFIQD